MDKLEWRAGRWTFIAKVVHESDALVRGELSGVTEPVIGGTVPAETYGPKSISAGNLSALRTQCEVLIMEKTGEKATRAR